MTEIDRWDVDGVTFHLIIGDDDIDLDEDDLPTVKPFFTSEQLKNMDHHSGSWRIKLTSDTPEDV